MTSLSGRLKAKHSSDNIKSQQSVAQACPSLTNLLICIVLTFSFSFLICIALTFSFSSRGHRNGYRTLYCTWASSRENGNTGLPFFCVATGQSDACQCTTHHSNAKKVAILQRKRKKVTQVNFLLCLFYNNTDQVPAKFQFSENLMSVAFLWWNGSLTFDRDLWRITLCISIGAWKKNETGKGARREKHSRSILHSIDQSFCTQETFKLLLSSKLKCVKIKIKMCSCVGALWLTLNSCFHRNSLALWLSVLFFSGNADQLNESPSSTANERK